MALRYVFANESGNQPASQLDQMFADVWQAAPIPCSSAGVNAITLTPLSNAYSPTGYQNYQRFAFVAGSNSSGNVTVQVGSNTALPLYVAGGVVQATTGNIVAGAPYDIMYVSTVNSGTGGFVIINSNTQPVPTIVRNAKTGNYTVQTSDLGTWIDGTSGSWTLTIPNPATLTSGFWFYFGNSGTGNITITPAAGTVDGLASYIAYPGELRFIQSDGASNMNSIVLNGYRLVITSTGANVITVPPKYTAHKALLGGAGGGGGGGARGQNTPATAMAGGAGGGAGMVLEKMISASAWTGAQTITIGTGGTPGTGATTNNAAGTNGGVGGDSIISGQLTAKGGGGGFGGPASATNAGGGGAGGILTAGATGASAAGGVGDFSTGGNGGKTTSPTFAVPPHNPYASAAGSGSTGTNAAGDLPAAGGSSGFGAGGGGAGGGVTTANTGQTGSAGGVSVGNQTSPAAGSAGSPGGTGTNGTVAVSGDPGPGGGGGGGANATTQAGGKGGDGVNSSGAGGGGAGLGANAGNGGTGGNGFAYIVGIP